MLALTLIGGRGSSVGTVSEVSIDDLEQEKWIIKFEELTILQELGTGAYGEVSAKRSTHSRSPYVRFPRVNGGDPLWQVG